MKHTFKRVFTLCLCALMLLGCMTACATGSAPEPTVAGPTEPASQAKVLKILTLGHSLAVDCGHMMNRILATEGIGDYEEVVIATLYYSGCPLYKHVNFLTNNSPEYNLYLSSTKTPDAPPTIMNDVTMLDALKFDYWDIIVMQGGVFEIAESETFTDGKIQIIQEYVNENKLNPLAYFAWHMPWATPTDNELRDMYPNSPNSYYSNYEKYGNERTNYYNGITKCVGDHIVTDESFRFLIPSGTAIENALSSYLEEKDLHRDYAHASDLGRVIASYTWYCKLMGVEQLDSIKLDAIPKSFLKSTEDKSQDRVLTDMEKAIIVESVNNALKNPLQVTNSQYTEAPAQ